MSLTLWNVALDPTRPRQVHLRDEPSTRLSALVTSAASFERHPVFGVGPGHLPGVRSAGPCDAHFTPLNIAATLGAPAMLAFLGIPALLWRRRRRPTDLALWGAMAGIGLDALAQDVEDFRHVWVLFGLLDADSRSSS